jgi:hypothetical protein
VRSAGEYERRYEDACHKLGINPTSDTNAMRRALLASTSSLPTLLTSVSNATRSDIVGDAIAYYHAFTLAAITTGDGMSTTSNDIIPTLCAIRTIAINNNDTTSTTSSSTATTINNDNNNNDSNIESGIDWGITIESSGSGGNGSDDMDMTMTTGTIDWGDDSSKANMDDDGICICI